MKEETFRQKQAFEIYYSMPNRSLERLREQLRNTPGYTNNTPSIDTLKSWSKKYNWQLRVEQRDIENGKSLEKKINETIVDEKVEIRKIIKANINILKQSIKDYIKQKRITEIRTLSDVNTLVNVLDKLTRLEMDLVGENMFKADIDLNTDSFTKILLSDTDLKEKLLKILEKTEND